MNSSPKEGVDETIGKITLTQMNLPLLSVPATATADEQQNELTSALIEENEQAGNGEEDESETHA